MKTAFDLSVFGTDGEVQAHNDLMQYMFQAEHDGVDARRLIQLLALLVLEMRRSVGNRTTELDEWDSGTC